MSDQGLDRQRFRGWLLVGIAAYAILSLIELTRVSLFSRPVRFETGLYGWEEAAHIENPRMRFRWSDGRASLLRPVGGRVLKLRLFEAHPSMPERGMPVTISIEGIVADEWKILDNGWSEALYYLPPILGPDTWMSVESGWANLEATTAREASWYQGWRELQPWRRRTGPTAISIAVDSAVFEPAALTESDDDRTLGVGLGQVVWLPEVPPDGIGFHVWETSPVEPPFRWTSSRRASVPVEINGTELVFRLRSAAADLGEHPMLVRLYWNERYLKSISLPDGSWSEVLIPASGLEGTRGILTLETDRTWVPAQAGESSDHRTLGVAVTRITER